MFQQLQKKISSQEKKLNNRLAKCALNFMKSRASHTSSTSQPTPHAQSTKSDWSDPVIMVSRPSPNVRLVLFQERGDSGDRPMIFDSKHVKKAKSPVCKPTRSYSNPDQISINSETEIKPQYEYQHKRCASDKSELLSEMLFGSVGMAQKVASLKIHYIKNPSAIMLSRVFCFSSFKENTTVSLDRGMENHLEAIRNNSMSSRRKANTMPVPFTPSTPPSSVASSYSSQSGGFFHRSDSGVSLSSLFSNSSKSSNGSSGTVAMRIPLACHGRAQSLPKHQRDSFTLSEELSYEKLPAAGRKTRMKIGFAVICEPEPSNSEAFQKFFFEHFPVIESHMTNLKEDIEKALPIRSKATFLEVMMKALDIFTTKLHLLYSSQRLPEPVWATLSMPTPGLNLRKIVIASFIGDLARLATEYNTKQRNLFFSGLLTAVLTNHLGWVASSTPNDCCRQDKTDELSYNALWAQLGDLYGAVGTPTKVCRTVVTGKGHELVSTVLSVLSYFIRSARVDEVIPVPKKITPVSLGVQKPLPQKEVSLSLVPSEIEDSEYVFISVSDIVDKQTETPAPCPPQQTSPPKTPVLRSKSSPQSPDKSNSSGTLSRSYSGPMMRNERRLRSNAFLDSKDSPRIRTYSNKVVTKPKVVQSRRKSHDPEQPAPAQTVNNLRSSFKRPSESNRSTTNLNIQGSFCMRQNIEIQLPEPRHNQPSNENSPSKASDSNGTTSSTYSQNVTMHKDSTHVCQVIPRFVDRLQPKVERVVNVRACPQFQERTPIDFPSLSPRPSKDRFSSNQSRNFSSCSSDSFEAPKDKASQNKSPTRSISNPSVCAKDNFTKGHRRCSSNSTGVKTRLVSRRRPLPTSTSFDDVQNTKGSENSPLDSASNSPSCQRMTLLRIPSVEMNHNAFDEYLVEGLDDAEAMCTHANSFSDSTETLKLSEDEDKASQSSHPTPHVTSCPDFNTSSNFTKDLQPHITRTPASLQTANQVQEVPKMYPSLSVDAGTPTPPPRRQSLSLNVQKVYPPLPAKPPVGFVSFNACDEQVSFHSKQRTDLPQRPQALSPRECLPATLSPSRQWSCQSNLTVKLEDPLDDLSLEEMPLADMGILEMDSKRKDNSTSDTTGFTSLMADYNQEYLNDFILHGAPNQPNLHQEIIKDLKHAISKPTLDEPIAEASCILADTDSWSVKVYSSQRLHSDRVSLPALTSKLVSCILNRVATMAKMKVDPEFCLNHLESELRQLVLKSRMLSQYAQGQKRVTMSQLTAALGIESQDLPLLMSIASCHSPHVAPIML